MSRPSVARLRAMATATCLSLGLALLGWTPGQWPAAARAECGVEWRSQMDILGSIGDRLLFSTFDTDDRRFSLWVARDKATKPERLLRIDSDFGRRSWLVDDILYLALTGKEGPELWRSDGTAEGSMRIHRFRFGPNGSKNPDIGPDDLIAVGDTVTFTAWDHIHGRERWRSDGTPEGTRLLRDIRPGPDGSRQFFAPLPAIMDGTLYFFADDGRHGQELWRSDGSPTGTTLVQDLVPGVAGISADSLDAVGDWLYFEEWDDDERVRGWRTDGTAAGTSVVAPGAAVADRTLVGDTIYGTAFDSAHGWELWRLDGSAGPVLVKDIRPGPAGSEPRVMTEVGGVLYFVADDGVHGPELWRSDGTAAGTRLVKDIRSGPGSSRISPLTAVGDELYFQAKDDEHGKELWRSDGTPEGTTLVRDIWRGAHGSHDNAYEFNKIVASGGNAYLTAYDGVHGMELWRSDGTSKGTQLVRDIRRGREGWRSDDHQTLTAVGDTLYAIVSWDCDQFELWRSDGTSKGTRRVMAVSGS